MSANDRLATVQAALKQRGVKDVKFFFSNDSLGTLSQAVEGASDVLEAYVGGRCVPAEKYIKQ
jgi:hypothetical protein